MAIASLVISTLSFVIIPLNLVGVFFGFIARRNIARSAGRIGGEAVAVTGIVIGAVSLIVSGIAITLLGMQLLAPTANREARDVEPTPLPVSVSPEAPESTPAPTFTHAERQPVRGGAAHRESWGELKVSDIDPEVVSLAESLDEERRLAARDGRQLLVLLVAPQCAACSALEKTLKSAPIQRRLSKVWLARVDARQFDSELEELRIPSDQTPALIRLNPQNAPLDVLLHAEWKDSSQENIALLLQEFMDGKLQQRKQPWRRMTQDGETPI
jgi:hypothetical protein